jgi:asparagine synthase (glutamine-hydrolysing)
MMSVQAGILRFDGGPISCDSLTRLAKTVAEYGPDSETTHCDGPLGLLYRALHTTAESTEERQPVVSNRGNVLVWDGRLDNREELALQLSDRLGPDKTDAGIVAAAFDQWSTECFARLFGDWAVSIWSPDTRELILARDYMGIRHLFYSLAADRITWCSHLAALVLCGKRLTLCDRYIAGYLASDPESHLTPYQEIKAVPSGSFVRIRRGKSAISRFYSYDKWPKIQYKTDAEYEEHYRHLLRQSVRRRLRTRSPILADLSGGFDSSSIVCMADEIIEKGGAEAARVDTISCYDLSEPNEDDFRHFSAVEKRRGRIGFHVDLQGCGDSLLFDHQAFSAIPSFSGRAEIKSAFSSILADNNYRVALSGLGGDEFNGQALNPRIQMADLLLQFRFVEFMKQLTAWSFLIRKRPWIQLFFQTVLQLAPDWIRARATDQAKVDPWINPEFARKYRMSVMQIDAARGQSSLYPSVRDAVHTIVALGNQASCLQPSVIETRYPFLDQQLVEFLTTIPLDQLLRPGERRFLMRRALENILPPEILLRKTKSLVSRCFAVTLEKHWTEVESLFQRPIGSDRGYFVTKRIYEALSAVKNGHHFPYVLRLLRAITLENWLRQAEAHGVIAIRHSPLALSSESPD